MLKLLSIHQLALDSGKYSHKFCVPSNNNKKTTYWNDISHVITISHPSSTRLILSEGVWFVLLCSGRGCAEQIN